LNKSFNTDAEKKYVIHNEDRSTLKAYCSYYVFLNEKLTLIRIEVKIRNMSEFVHTFFHIVANKGEKKEFNLRKALFTLIYIFVVNYILKIPI